MQFLSESVVIDILIDKKFIDRFPGYTILTTNIWSNIIIRIPTTNGINPENSTLHSSLPSFRHRSAMWWRTLYPSLEMAAVSVLNYNCIPNKVVKGSDSLGHPVS